MEQLTIEKINEVYIKVHCSAGVSYELKNFFTFKVPGYQFTPQYKNKMWNGDIYLFNPLTQLIYAGLLPYIEEFCLRREYTISYAYDNSSEEFSVKEVKEFISTLNLPFEPRPYQIEAFIHCVRDRRKLLLSPTASGKSLIIYILYRYYNKKTLLIVPNTNLISQMASDFISYNYEDIDQIHKIYSGQEKNIDKQLYISTWQSIYKQPKKWFDKFDVVLGDEAHGFKAKSLTSIMTKLENCVYRFGFTGTLDGTQTHKLCLEGLFGQVRKVITTAEMIENQYSADFRIKNIVFTYPEAVCKEIAKCKYPEEIDFLLQLKKRNRFILNLALSLEGNTLILFRYVEKHGEVLYNMLKEMNPDCPIYFISGKIDGETRDEIRKILDTHERSITIASEGTVSTGVNVPNLHNAIFSSPFKARIKTLQSIGRILRKSKNGQISTLYDLADDMTYKSKRNYTLEHFIERIGIYNEEKFNYKTYRVSLKV